MSFDMPQRSPLSRRHGGGPAGAVVKGQDNPALATHAVMVLKSNGGFCSGVVLSPTVVLTAGHCVTGASAFRVHFKGPGGEPVMLEPRAISVHPGYVAGAAKARRNRWTSRWCACPRPCRRRFLPRRLPSPARRMPARRWRSAAMASGSMARRPRAGRSAPRASA